MARHRADRAPLHPQRHLTAAFIGLESAPEDRLRSTDSVVEAPALAVLADPTRARMVRLIRDAEGGRAMVSRLAEQLGLRQPTVSHHMAALHAEGLVVREPEGRRVWYSISPDEADRVTALLGAPALATEEIAAAGSATSPARIRVRCS